MVAAEAGGPVNDKACARLLAVEVLLSYPEDLGNDALETDLYILRDQLLAELPLSSLTERNQSACPE
jgi:hypothetical protein